MHQIVIICPECGTRNVCSPDSFPDCRFTCVGAGCEIDCSRYSGWSKSWEGNYEVFSIGVRNQNHTTPISPKPANKKLIATIISAIAILVLIGAAFGLYAYINRWEKGKPHPQNPNLVASWHRGKWEATRPGYKWVEGTAFDRWESEVRHPDNLNLATCEEEGKWRATEAGYVWAGGSRTEWRAGLPHDTFPHWHSSDEEGKWTPDPGYVKKDPSCQYVSELVWKSEEEHPKYKHWVSSIKEGRWHTEAGYVKVYPNVDNGSDSRAWVVKWSSGIEHPEHPNVVSGEGEGKWHPASGYAWVDPNSENDWRVKRKPTPSYGNVQPLPQQQNGVDALNSMATILQEWINLNALANTWPTDWHGIERSADALLRECRKLQQSGFDSQELRGIIRDLLELKRKAESEIGEENAIRRSTPKYA